MPEIEDPVVTLVRLLQKNIRVVRDDDSLATIYVGEQWYDRELFKNCDGQVTVGLDRCEDNKIGFSASFRRRVLFARVNIWSVNKPEQTVNGRRMRDEIRDEVNRVIRQKRTKPNETRYDFVGVGQATEGSKAWHTGSAADPSPDSQTWNEFDNDEYEQIWYSDDERASNSVNVNLECALMLFRFKVDPYRKTVKKLVLKFEGYGTAPAGNGVTVKVWNFTVQTWQNPVAGTGGADEDLTVSLLTNLTDFIDANGYVYLFAKTTNPSDGSTPAVLFCDYVECTATVEGITYCDIVSYRDENQVNVKPFIWRTEFIVKSWLFETVPET